MIVSQKLEVFFIFQPILDMKCQGQKVKDIEIHFFVVITHGIEQSFFVTNHVVVYQMIMHFSLLYFINFDVLFVFEKFSSRLQSLVIVLFSVEVDIKVVFVLPIVKLTHNRLFFVLHFLKLCIVFSQYWFLKFKVV